MDVTDHNSQPRDDWRPGVATRMRISALTGSSALSIFEQWCGPGLGAPTHWHPVEEVLTVLSGQAEFWIGADRISAGANQSVLIPAKVRHGFRNVGDGKLHIMAVLASPVFEAHFDDQTVIHRWSPDNVAG